MAVKRTVLIGSLAFAVVVSLAGGYALSRGDDTTSPDDDITVTSNGTFVEPGIAVNKPVQGKPLPTVQLVAIDGSHVSTSELLGQPLVINVWATSCEACKREMPALAQMHAEFGDQVRFIGINQFANNDIALAFAKDKGVRYELLSDLDGEFVTALGITGLPYTLFVAPDGTIVSQKGIALDVDTLRSTIIEKLVKQ